MMTAPERGAKMFQRGTAPRSPQFGPDIFTSSHQQWDSKIAAKSVLWSVMHFKKILPIIGIPTLYKGRKKDRSLGSA